MMKRNKAVSEELYNLLCDVKAFAVKQMPVSFNSFARSIEQLGYTTLVEEIANNHFHLVILKPIKNTSYCKVICAIELDYINSTEVLIYGCKYSEIRELEYVIHEGVLMPFKW